MACLYAQTSKPVFSRTQTVSATPSSVRRPSGVSAELETTKMCSANGRECAEFERHVLVHPTLWVVEQVKDDSPQVTDLQ